MDILDTVSVTTKMIIAAIISETALRLFNEKRDEENFKPMG
ncbi:MAG: hypothetical protein QW842_00050 [Candidatus Nezhaarchaeales archaeon]